MERFFNIIQLAKWKLRYLLNIPQKTVAPLLWRPSAITSHHEPSHRFRSQLTTKQSAKLDEIMKEMTLLSKLSVRFPTKFTDENWKTLLQLETRKARLHQASFLYNKERLAKVSARKDEERKAILREKAAARSRDPSYILNFPTTISEEYYKMRRLVEAYRLEESPTIAIDCQFLSRLSHRGRGLTALQLQYLIAENRKNANPFRMYFINYDWENSEIKRLEGSKLQGLSNCNCINPLVTNQGLSSKDIFQSGGEVIYLSPDASQELNSVDDDKIYVIGGIVDRIVEPGIPRQASLEAAQQSNVLVRKLPIDRYIDFKSGSKFLTLLAVTEILRQVNLHGDWKKAMDVAIPVRNTKSAEEKNPKARAAHAKIMEFNNEMLRLIDKKLGKNTDYIS